MGAATTLLYAYKDPRISAICVDSPFENFKLLAEELVVKQINLPKFIIDGALKIVQGTVKKKNGLDIYKLKPIENVANTFQPALFIHAINDELINVQHSINIFNNYGGPKSLKCCDKGGHNTKRPKIIKKEIGNFFHKYLCTNASEKEIKESNIIHSYKIEEEIDYNNINKVYFDDDIAEYEYEQGNINEYEDLDNIYEEDYIVNQIIQSQNGGQKEKNNIQNKDEKNKNSDNNKIIDKTKTNKRAEKIIKEEKIQMEQMKEAFMNLNINNNLDNNNDNNNNIDNNIENENENDDNLININNNQNYINDDMDNEEEYKNNSNSPREIENGGKTYF